MFHRRLTSLQATLQPQTALFLSDPHDIRYLANIETLVAAEREAYVLVTKEHSFIFHSRFCPVVYLSKFEYLIGCHGPSFVTNLQKTLVGHKIKKMAIDKSTLTAEEYETLQAALPTTSSIILTAFDKSRSRHLRAHKDSTERAALTQAGRIAAQVWQLVQPTIRVGVSEKEVKHELETALLSAKSESPAFPTIVAFGPHTALPHHQPTTTQLVPDMPVLVDFGATIDGYHSDMTRSFWFGPHPNPEYLVIERLVFDAYQTGLAALTALPLPALAPQC